MPSLWWYVHRSSVEAHTEVSVCTNQDGVVSGEHRKCSPGSMRADPIEDAVWDALVSSLQRPDLIEIEYNRRMKTENAVDGTELEAKRLKRMIDDVQRRDKRLLDAYLAEALDLNDYKSESEKVKIERTEIERQLNRVEQTRKHAVQQIETLAGLEDFCNQVSSGIDKLDPDGRRRLVELLVEQIDLEPDDRIRIHLVIPPNSPMKIGSGELRQRHPEALEGRQAAAITSIDHHAHRSRIAKSPAYFH